MVDRVGESVSTFFAPAGRATPSAVAALARTASDDPLVRVILRAVGGLVMVVSGHRQILAASPELLESLGLQVHDAVGRRPGEALGCENVARGPDGCGTAEDCQHCGAVLSILAALRGQPASGECLLSLRRDGAVHGVEMQAHATPLRVSGNDLVVLVLHDVSSLKRRQALERLFLHDLNNVLSGLMLWAGQLAGAESSEAARAICELSQRLAREIEAQHLLVRAENGTLVARPRPTSLCRLLGSIRTLAEPEAASHESAVEVREPEDDLTVTTDEVLLSRVVVNMAKNALEASRAGGRVQIWSEVLPDNRLAISVRNEGAIPREVATRMFRRSFSTKGPGRGLGTYSMRLFGEQILGGKVSFESSAETGTVFCVEVPIS